MSFKKICIVDILSRLPDRTKEAIEHLSRNPVRIISNLGDYIRDLKEREDDADCLLVSLRTNIDMDVLERFPDLLYIGVYGTSLGRVDLEEAKARRIAVTNVSEYCDRETAEFVLTELLKLVRGLGECRWKGEPHSIFGKTLGIVGMGSVGKELAKMASGLGMEVIYFSRTRKPESEKQGFGYVPLETLLSSSHFISFHVPPSTPVLSKREFDLIPEGSAIFNTCVGRLFDQGDFIQWIGKGKNVAIFDAVAARPYPGIGDMKNVSVSPAPAFQTEESVNRLNEKFLQHMKDSTGGG